MSKRKKHIAIALLTSLLTLSIAILFSYEYTRLLPEGTHLGQLSLQGLNRFQAREAIREEMRKYSEMKITLEGNENHQLSFTPRELGIDFDEQQTLMKIFDQSSWFVRVFADEKRESDLNTPYKPVINIAEDHLREVVSEYLIALEKDAVNAHVEWREGKWSIFPALVGAQIEDGEVDRIVQQISTSLYPRSEEITSRAIYREVAAERVAEELSGLLASLEETLSTPILLKYGKEAFEIHLFESPEWLIIDEDGKTFQLNEEYAKERIQQLAREFDRKPGHVVVTGIEEQVSEYDQKVIKKAVFEGSFSKGQKSDQEKWLTDLKELFENPKADREMLINWETQYPIISSLVPGYTFPQILSTGTSSFRLGNHPNRIKNIKLSLESFTGIIIESGEELSFNRVTGWITPGKGYTKTQIISEGKVEEGIGGGVCQSSTTVYRALLNAGVPVTERRNHTLDISYYHSFGYGLDATVYTDSRSDLKFVNDFPGPIIVYASTDDDLLEAYIDFYGTTDQRVVELTNIPTGDYLLKKWEWKIMWPEKEEIRYVISRYIVPKKEEEKEKKEESNPLEA